MTTPKTKLRRRILRNLIAARETVDLMIENLQFETQDGCETSLSYLLKDTKIAAESLNIVLDLIKDDLRNPLEA